MCINKEFLLQRKKNKGNYNFWITVYAFLILYSLNYYVNNYDTMVQRLMALPSDTTPVPQYCLSIICWLSHISSSNPLLSYHFHPPTQAYPSVF